MSNSLTLKTFKNILILAVLFISLANTSCRKEEMEFEQAPPEDTLSQNSQVAYLMQRMAMNDGSVDNIICNANCFTIQKPVTVVANGIEVNINSISDLDIVEDIFDDDDDDSDTLEIQFPIIIVMSDHTTMTINSSIELYTYASNCNGENEWDEDIECLDFQYPISALMYNSNNEIISTVTLNNDLQMYTFIDDIDENDIITIDFPISVILSNGTSLTINTLNELQTTIEIHEDDCDEDDDFDYNDDDCDTCTPLLLTETLTNCTGWIVDKLKRNDYNYDDVYNGYLFNFDTDGTISVTWDTTTVYGTWSASGIANDITVVIDIPSLPYCNLNWRLHEIKERQSETKIDLREGDDDRLRYYNICN